MKKLFSSLSLRLKIVLICVFLALDGIVITAIAYIGIHKVDDEFLKITNISIPNIEKVTEMDLSFRSTRIHLTNLGLVGISKNEFDQSIVEVKKYIEKFNVAFSKYDFQNSSDQEKELLKKLELNWKQFEAIVNKVLQNAQSGNTENLARNSEIFLKECPESAEKLYATFRELNKYQTIKAEEFKKNALTITDKVDRLTILVAIIGMSVGLILALYVSGQISKHLAHIAETLNLSANEVSAASHQIASTSTELSQSTSEQAASLEQTVASVEEMTSIVRKNSENADASSNKASLAQSKVIQGKQTVDEVIRAIKEINDSNQFIVNQINQSNVQMNEIVQLIQEIEQKTKVINEIVFQTKLLSFNASVEAARAGENGKGFAVVAEEVGNLASMSGNASKEISTLLENSVSKVKTIAEDTEKNVSAAINKGQVKLKSGILVAEQCRNLLDSIVIEVEQVTKMSKEISEASQEQSQGISEINKAMNQLDQVTQVNASATEQASAAAEHLSNQAQQLKHVTEILIKTVEGDSMAS